MDKAISDKPNIEFVIDQNSIIESETLEEQESTKPKMIESGKSLSDQKAILKQALPLLCLLGINILYQNSSNIFLFVSLLVVFDYANNLVTRNCMLGNNRSILNLLPLCGFCALIFFLVLPIVSTYWICNLLSLNSWSKQIGSFWDILYIVCIFDFLMKFMTICIKCIILLPKMSSLSLDRRGGLFIICESASQIIRSLLPVPEWIKFMLSSPSCVAYFLCLASALLYLVIKFSTFKTKLKVLKHGWKLFRFPLVVGSPVSEIQETNCPICHIKYSKPVVLSCGHTFCHECCQQWFNHESQCPVCSSAGMNALIMGSINHLPKLDVIAPKSCRWKIAATEYIIQLC